MTWEWVEGRCWRADSWVVEYGIGIRPTPRERRTQTRLMREQNLAIVVDLMRG